MEFSKPNNIIVFDYRYYSEGLLTMVQRLDFQERLAFSGPLDRLNLIEVYFPFN